MLTAPAEGVELRAIGTVGGATLLGVSVDELRPPGRGRKLAMCGVFGVRSEERDVARLSYFGLFALQHRGQESAGIAVSDGGRITALREMGLVTQVFREEPCRHCPARSRSATPATRPPARAPGRTRSRSSAPERRDSSRSGTTGTSSTPRSCARSCVGTASGSSRRPTPR